MSEKRDAVVIGAGMGGLAAAARLSDAGLRVLVTDTNGHVGGTAFVYFREGFTFPMGPLGISSPDLVRECLSKLGLEPVQLTRVHYRLRAFDLDLPVSLPLQDMKKELAKSFPADAKGVERFFDQVINLKPGTGSNGKALDRSAPAKASRTPAREFIGSLVSDYRLRRVLGSIGAREPYSSLFLISVMWQLLCSQGIWYPSGGMHGLARKLSSSISRHENSEVRLGEPVQEILVENDCVRGVKLVSGETIESSAVVSNADFKRTFLELVEPKSLPAEFRQNVSDARQTESTLQVCLGVDADRTDLSAFEHGTRIIYQRHPAPSSGPDWTGPEIKPDELAGQELEISLWSADDPALAPAGKEVIVIRVEADYHHFSRFRTGPLQRTRGYYDYKMKLGQALVEDASSLLPGLTGAVEVMDVATPLTFRDRGGRTEGAVAGWSWDYEDNQEHEARELVDTPVKGLYMAGYQALSSLFAGGVPTALQSGLVAAQRVLAVA
ncbi:MAG: NAD(P)/FAD-dependent oxidoreductase [bacterium]